MKIFLIIAGFVSIISFGLWKRSQKSGVLKISGLLHVVYMILSLFKVAAAYMSIFLNGDTPRPVSHMIAAE